MRVINLASKANKDTRPGALNDVLGRLNTALAGADARAQDNVAQRLGRVLDNRFYLLQNLPAAGVEALPVMLLAGPVGLWVLHASAVRGLYRVAGEQWEIMDKQGKDYRPARPNLVEELQTARQALAERIAALGLDLPAPEAALLFVEPGAHVDSLRPVLRVVQADALEGFAARLFKSAPLISDPLVRQLVEALTEGPAEEAEVAFADLEGRQTNSPKEPSRLDQFGQEEPEMIKRLALKARFSRRQWIILGVLLLVNIIVLFAVILVALITV